jgi:hypothetical protein
MSILLQRKFFLVHEHFVVYKSSSSLHCRLRLSISLGVSFSSAWSLALWSHLGLPSSSGIRAGTGQQGARRPRNWPPLISLDTSNKDGSTNNKMSRIAARPRGRPLLASPHSPFRSILSSSPFYDELWSLVLVPTGFTVDAHHSTLSHSACTASISGVETLH